jgi:large subunit ribosomal protein L4
MTAPVDVRAQDGSVTATVELDPEFFGVQPNVHLMHQVVIAQLAAGRRGTQSTKTRAEVSGGGAKPFKQKGTGRARQGSTRSPHYSGGGIALGPKPRSYRQRTPRKMVQLALKGALSDRAGLGQVAVVEGWDWAVPSTKDAKAALSALGVTGKVLIVLSRDDERAYKSFRNIPELDLILVGELAAYDVLCSDWIVFTRQTLPGNNTWGEASAAASKPKAEPKAKVEPRAQQAPTAEPEQAAVTVAEPTASAAEEPGPSLLEPDDEAKPAESKPTRRTSAAAPASRVAATGHEPEAAVVEASAEQDAVAQDAEEEA